MLTVTRTTGRDGKEYSNVTAVSPVPPSLKRLGLPEGHNPKTFFDLDSPDMALFDTFCDKLKVKIQAAPEWPKGSAADNYQREQNASAKSLEDMDDDIPF